MLFEKGIKYKGNLHELFKDCTLNHSSFIEATSHVIEIDD